MKKLFYSAAIMALAFFAGSCQQENLEPVGGNTVTYTVQVPDALATKVVGEDVTAVTELIYEVYRTEAQSAEDHSQFETKLYQKTATLTAGVARVELELVNNQNFRVLFWAQVPENGVYNTADLKDVKLAQSLDANAEKYNAFAGADYIKSGDNLVGRTITLVRPIAQLNIATTPGSLKLGEDANGVAQTTITVNTSTVTVDGLSTSYNVSEAKAGDDAVEFVYAAKPVNLSEGTINVDGNDYTYLAMNYVGFAGKSGSNVEVSYVISTSEGDITNDIDNVPVKANYRTNIVGNLITATSDYTVTLDAEWDGVAEEVEIWDGKFLSQPAFDDATSTWSVKKASELAWLAAAVNGEVAVTRATEETFAGETFVLTADIDLGNYPWTPIGLTGDKDGFQGVFDGNGKTISNLYVDLTAEPKYQSAGLFGSARYATIKNLTIKNATIKNLDTDAATSNGTAVVVGAAQFASTIDNVHVVNAVVTSNRRAAGIAGYFVGTIQNCSVDGLTATITPDDYDGDGKYKNGDKAGGILATTNGATVLKNNVVKNANIKGYRNLGGLAGAANLGENSSNKVENTVVTVDRTYAMFEDDPALSGPIVGRILGGTLDDSNVATDVVVVSTEEDVETPDSFAEALANVADGGVVAVSGEISTTSLNAAGKNITIVGTTEDAVINSSADRLTTSGNITFKNVTLTLPTTGDYFKGHNMSGGTLVFDNCKFVGCVCVMNANVTYNNCEFTNPDKYAAWVYSGKATYNNCTFTGPDRAVKVYAENANAPEVYYNDCTFRALTAADDNKTAVEVDCKTRTSGTPYYVEINNPIIENMGIAEHNAIGDRVCNLETNGVGLGIVNLNGKGYSVAHTAAQLQALTNAGKDVTIELAQDITGDFTYEQNDGEDVVIDGADKKMTGTITVKARIAQKAANTFVIKNLNFYTNDTTRDFIKSSETNYYPHITVSNCTFEGPSAESEVVPVRVKTATDFLMENCTATNVHSLLQNDRGGLNYTVRDCIATNVGRGINLNSVQGALVENVKIDASDEKYGIRVDAEYVATTTIKNCEISAFCPVVVRKASAAYNLVFDGTNTMTAANTDGLWCVIGTSEYEKNGELPSAATGAVKVTLNDAGLSASGVHGASAIQ